MQYIFLFSPVPQLCADPLYRPSSITSYSLPFSSKIKNKTKKVSNKQKEPSKTNDTKTRQKHTKINMESVLH